MAPASDSFIEEKSDAPEEKQQVPPAAVSERTERKSRLSAIGQIIARLFSAKHGQRYTGGSLPGDRLAKDVSVEPAATSVVEGTPAASDASSGSPSGISSAPETGAEEGSETIRVFSPAAHADSPAADTEARDLEPLKKKLREILGDRKDIDDARTMEDIRAIPERHMAEVLGEGSLLNSLTDDDDDDDDLPVMQVFSAGPKEPEFVNLRRIPDAGNPELANELSFDHIFAVLCAEVVGRLEKLRENKEPAIVLCRSSLAGDHAKKLAVRFDAMIGVLAQVLPAKETKEKHRDLRIASLSRCAGGTTTVIVTTPTQAVESCLLEVVDIEIETRPISAELVSKIYSHCLTDKVAIPNEEWVRLLTPTDLLLVDREYPCKIADKLKARVLTRRSRAGSSKEAVPLSDLHGLGYAKQWALNTIADIKAAAVGEISWDDIDNGALIDGPPGVGKTALVRAIAADSGVPVHATTATSWMGAGSLDDILQAMNSDFEIARTNAPSILFIDEIDAMGNRASGNGGRGGDQWITWTVNHLLTLIDGFSRKQKIIVIGATNHAGNVDAALRRAGRLDRTITVALPKEDDRKAIFRTYLRRFEHNVTPESIDHLGRISAGLSGADIEMYVREAKGRARRKRRQVHLGDLIACINGMPEDVGSEPLAPSTQENAAWRMAGKAVIAHVYGVGEILQLSVYPRSDGKVGSTAIARVDRPLKDREHFRVAMAVELAERAVEEHRFGKERGTSASGHVFDVSVKIAQEMVKKKWRLSEEGPYLTEGFGYSREIDEKVEQEVKSAYALALGTIKRHNQVVKEVAGLLLAQSEMTGAEFYAIVNRDKDLGAAHRFLQQITS